MPPWHRVSSARIRRTDRSQPRSSCGKKDDSSAWSASFMGTAKHAPTLILGWPVSTWFRNSAAEATPTAWLMRPSITRRRQESKRSTFSPNRPRSFFNSTGSPSWNAPPCTGNRSSFCGGNCPSRQFGADGKAKPHTACACRFAAPRWPAPCADRRPRPAFCRA